MLRHMLPLLTPLTMMGWILGSKRIIYVSDTISVFAKEMIVGSDNTRISSMSTFSTKSFYREWFQGLRCHSLEWCLLGQRIDRESLWPHRFLLDRWCSEQRYWWSSSNMSVSTMPDWRANLHLHLSMLDSRPHKSRPNWAKKLDHFYRCQYL